MSREKNGTEPEKNSVAVAGPLGRIGMAGRAGMGDGAWPGRRGEGDVLVSA